ncbi:MAG: type II toxin-antitoxin system VapC family toxin [Planctomycetota bacterium]
MNPTVYLETTIIGYLAMQPSGVLRIAANQQTTHEWWTEHRHRFSVYVSRLMVSECAAGDSVATADRLRVLAEVPLLEVTADAESLAAALLEETPLSAKATAYALHIAVAAVNGVEYLLTWNCRHIANPSLRPRIESVCRRMGFEPPVISTPRELLEIDDGN